MHLPGDPPSSDAGSLLSTHRGRLACGLVEIALIFALFCLNSAWPVPDVNETYYLGKAMHYWKPAWLQGDFFMETADTHKTFYYLFGWLSVWLSPTALAWTGRMIAWWLLAWSWRRLSFAVVPRAWCSVLTAALFGCLMERCHMAGEWVIGGAEAKPFAYVLVFLGLKSLARNRWNRALALFGAAAAFHVLVGGWTAIAVGIAWLRMKWIKPARDVPPLKSLWPGILIGLALASPGLLPSLLLNQGIDAETARMANQIYVFERLPHHLTLTGIKPWFIARIVLLWLFWLLLGRWESPPMGLATLRAFVAGAVLIAFVGAALNAIMFFDRAMAADLLRYYWYRLADVALPLGVALEGAAWAIAISSNSRGLTAPGEQSNPSRIDRGFTQNKLPLRSDLTRNVRSTTFLVLAILASAANLGVHIAERISPSAPRSHRIVNFAAWRAACDWVANSGEIPHNARFLVPRLAQTFKWYTGRSDTATWKDVPQDARSLVAWWDRIQAIYATGLPAGPRWFEPLSAAGEQRLLELGRRYAADYLIAERNEKPLSLEKVYENDAYEIYRLKQLPW